MPNYKKYNFPVDQIRRFIEPGPIGLVSSVWKTETNIMPMSWHMVMEFSPSLIDCYTWTENHSFEMIPKSKECTINIPTVDSISNANSFSHKKYIYFCTCGITRGKNPGAFN